MWLRPLRMALAACAQGGVEGEGKAAGPDRMPSSGVALPRLETHSSIPWGTMEEERG